MEPFFEFILECVIQLFGDVILDALLRSRHPIANLIGITLLACFAGLLLASLSLAIHSHHIIGSFPARVGMLVIFPIVNGLLMSVVGRHFARRGKLRSGFEYFLPAFVFSLTFGAIRFVCAK